MNLKTRTIRHTDGSKIQVRTPVGMHPASQVSSRVYYQGQFLGTVSHGKGWSVFATPVLGAYVGNLSSIARGARILVDLNEGMGK